EVVDHERAQAGEARGRCGRLHRAGGLLLEADLDPEGAAPSRRTLEADVPAHQIDEPATDRESEPRPAVAARGRAVRLREAVEDRLLPVGRDADAGVAHGEPDADVRRPVREDVDLDA